MEETVRRGKQRWSACLGHWWGVRPAHRYDCTHQTQHPWFLCKSQPLWAALCRDCRVNETYSSILQLYCLRTYCEGLDWIWWSVERRNQNLSPGRPVNQWKSWVLKVDSQVCLSSLYGLMLKNFLFGSANFWKGILENVVVLQSGFQIIDMEGCPGHWVILRTLTSTP